MFLNSILFIFVFIQLSYLSDAHAVKEYGVMEARETQLVSDLFSPSITSSAAEPTAAPVCGICGTVSIN
jgi:hypothetical protein